MTAIALGWERDTREISLANAGHGPAWLIRDHQISPLARSGDSPLGLQRQSKYRRATHTLQPGEKIVFMTDGIVECPNPHQDEWGEKAMKAETPHLLP